MAGKISPKRLCSPTSARSIGTFTTNTEAINTHGRLVSRASHSSIYCRDRYIVWRARERARSGTIERFHSTSITTPADTGIAIVRYGNPRLCSAGRRQDTEILGRSADSNHESRPGAVVTVPVAARQKRESLSIVGLYRS